MMAFFLDIPAIITAVKRIPDFIFGVIPLPAAWRVCVAGCGGAC
jgi:hypothetical protein